MVGVDLVFVKKFEKEIILLAFMIVVSCQTELDERGTQLVENVNPIANEIVESLSEARNEMGDIAENASEKILQSTKEFVESASSNLKEAGQKLAGEDNDVENAELETQLSSDDGTLDLSQFSFEQQKIDRDKAAAFILEVREKRIIIEPGDIPDIIATVNIAAYARSTKNPIGKRVFKRNYIKSNSDPNNCARFKVKDDAQRYFLANGGPMLDPLKLDPDGDGYACFWNPKSFRVIILED